MALSNILESEEFSQVQPKKHKARNPWMYSE